MIKKIKILAVFYKDVTTHPVLESTEFTMLSELSKEKYRLFIINHAPLDKILQAREEKSRIPPATVKRWVVPFYNKYVNCLIDSILVFYVVIRFKIDIIFARELYLSCLGVLVKSILRRKFVFRMKALFVAEREFIGINPVNRLVLRQCEKLLLKCSDLVMPCSDNMVSYIRKFRRSDPIVSMPNYIVKGKFEFDENLRNEVRGSLNLAERLVFIYSGGAYKWQHIDESIAIFKHMHALDNKAFLLVLSYQKDEMRKYLNGVLDDTLYALMSLSHSEIPKYLMAGDAGFMLRAKGAMSEASSPIKFGEYIGCGLPVILAGHLGDCPEIVRSNNFGIILDDYEDEKARKTAAETIMQYMKTLDLQGKRRISDWANTYYTYEYNIHKFEDAISGLIKK